MWWEDASLKLVCCISDFVLSSFRRKKWIVVSMIIITSWFGGRNMFFGTAYVIMCVLCMVLTILFFVKHKPSPRDLGYTRYLIWKNILNNNRVQAYVDGALFACRNYLRQENTTVRSPSYHCIRFPNFLAKMSAKLLSQRTQE